MTGREQAALRATIGERILEILGDREMVSADVAKEVGIPVQRAASLLRVLEERGAVEKCGYRERDRGSNTDNVIIWRVARPREAVAETPEPVVAKPPPLPPVHTNLTAALLGDPLPGRSALDQLRAAR